MADTYYWSADGSTPGGTGTWNTTDLRWGTTLSGPFGLAWDNLELDTALFGGGGTTSRTVTMAENITVGGLQFDARTYTIDTNGSTLSFGAADNTVLFGGNRDTTAANITGAVAGSGNVSLEQRIFPLSSTLTFSGISAGGWSGTTSIGPGTTLATTTTSGNVNRVLGSTSGITLNGNGTLRLNRATNANIDAINDSAAISVNGGGTFFVQSADAGGVSAIENIGAVTVNSGQMNFVFGNNASSGQQVVMAGLTRAGATSALTFSGSSLSTSNKFIVTGAGSTAAGEIIGAWATTGPANGQNTQTDYAVFSSNEVHSANIAASAESTWSTTHAANSNYTLANAAGTVADGVLTAARNINTLRNATTPGVATANSTTEYFTLAGNAFSDGDLITVSGTGGTAAGVPYYVINAGGAGADTFQISTTPSGSAVNLSNTTAGQISGGLNLNGNNLGTFGILNGTTNSSSGFAIAGTGSVTLPTASSGNLYITTSASAMTIDSVIADNGAGVLTLVKNGSNTLTLRGANTYTGDLVINQGTVAFTALGAIGPTGKNISFDGSGTISSSFNTEYIGGVLSVKEGAVGTIGRAMRLSFTSTTGSGKLIYQGIGNASAGLDLGNASGFTGTIEASISSGTNPRPFVLFSAMNDAPGSALQAGGGQQDSNQPTYFEFNGSAPLTFNNRIIEFLPRSGGNNAPRFLSLANKSVHATNTWVINTDVVNNNDRGNNLGALILDGTNTGDNELAGQYGNSTYNGQVFNLTKSGNGKWIVSNAANSYSGITTITGGTLEVKVLADGGSNSSIGASSSAATNLLLGHNTTLRYTGAGHSTDRLFTINGTNNGHQATINSSGTGAVEFTNTGSLAYGVSNETRTLNLRGTNTGNNTLAALIADNGTAAVSLTKNDAGTWVLSSANTYTGVTTISGGVLRVSSGGSINGSSGVTLNGGTLTYNSSVPLAAPLTFTSGTLSGSGTIDQALTVNGSIAPGNSIDTLTVGGSVTWNGSASAPWVFELGPSNTADLLAITGGSSDFLKGTGTGGADFLFDFGGSTVGGTFDLVSWTGSTDFLVSDFSYTNLGGGNTGTFAISGSTLQFAIVVPEPATIVLVASAAGLFGLRGVSRRKRA